MSASCSMATSALSEDDDGSELTELRLAQEALFAVAESVTTSQRDSESVTSSEIKEISVDHTAPTALSSSMRSGGSGNRSKDLSSLDIVMEEQPRVRPDRPSLATTKYLDFKETNYLGLVPLKEGSGSDDDDKAPREMNPRDEMRMSSIDMNMMLDDLPTSTTPLNRRSSADDSVSYSDIDGEMTGNLPPPMSIKMCMTVRNSMIEREFATEQMTDVEFGETKGPAGYDETEMTLEDLLEGGQLNDSFHPLGDSQRDTTGNNTASSKKSSSKRTLNNSASRHFLKTNVMRQMDTNATKNLRRKNKRLWKFCVWNCRKITVFLVLGLCLLIGIALLTWWGVARVTGKSSNAEEGAAVVATEVETNSDFPGSTNPSGPENKQWPPTNDTGRIPPPLESESPTVSPSSFTSSISFVAPAPMIELPPESPSLSSTAGPALDPSIDVDFQPPSSSSPDIPAIVNTTNNTNTSIIYSYEPTNSPSARSTYLGSENSTEPQAFPSFHPSTTLGPSSHVPFIQSPTANTTSDTQPYPSPSPSISIVPSSIIQTPTINMSYVSSYPSTSPSNGSTSFGTQTPTLYLASSNISSYPSSSPSVYNTTTGSTLSPSSNISTATITPTLSSSNNASDPSSNTSKIETPLANSTNDFPLITNQSFYESVHVISGAQQSEYAGASVSMSSTGEYVAVGFKEADGPSVEKTGLVRVYQRNSDNTYTPLGADVMFGTATGDEFGASVSISNDGFIVAVGARSSSTRDKQKNGETRVFEYSVASNSWSQLGSSIQGLDEKDRLGFSVSISGDGNRVAVGAPRGNGGTGSSSVYEYNGLDWTLFGNVVVGGSDGDRAGFSVSLSNDGDTLAMGAFTSSTADLAKCGSVSVYELVGSTADASSSVNLVQTLSGAVDEAQFGYSVSLSENGSRLVAGSRGYLLCEVYALQDGYWTQINALARNEENEETGSQVSMSQKGNVVSCSENTLVDGDIMRGAVSVREEIEMNWNVVDTIFPSFGDSTSFGSSMSLSQDGNMVVVGAPSHDSSTGFFEIFSRSG